MKNSIQKALKAFSLAAAFALSSSNLLHAQSAAQDWAPFIDAAELDALVQSTPDLQIIDIRKAKHIADGVIPGALWMPFADWRGTEDRPSQPPTEEEFEALLSAHGLNIDDPIVVHHRAGKTIQTGRAAIVYWLLKSAGAQEVAILDGGYAAWTDAG